MNTLTTTTGIIEKEWNGQRVVTFKEIDQCHGHPNGVSKRNFNRNKDHFVEGQDFYRITRRELRDIMSPNSKSGNPNLIVTLITKSGYLMIAKSLTDKKAWDIQRVLVDSYFDKKEHHPAPIQTTELSTELNPQLQMFKALFDNAVAHDKKIAEHDDRIEAMEKKMKQGFELPETTQDIDALFLHPVVLYTTTEIGKAFGISARAINRYLLSQDIHHPYKRGWRLNEKYRDLGYVEQKIGHFNTSEGKAETALTYWTATGKDFVCAMLKNAGLRQKSKVKQYNRHDKRNRTKGRGRK